MIDFVIVVAPKSDGQKLEYSIQFINSKILEDRFVSRLMSDISDDSIHNLQPKLREEYLRNRFRSYMNRFKLYRSSAQPFDLQLQLVGNKIQFSQDEPNGN